MDAFKAGDKIFYPNQGLGVVEDIQNENLYGEHIKIYHVRIFSNNTLILVPSASAKEIGIRKPIAEKAVDKIFDFMRKGEINVSMNWKGRYKEHVNLMKSGSILDIALVLKSLFYLSLIKPLSFREKKMMEKAMGLLVSEISEVSSQPGDDIEDQLMENLNLCFSHITPRVES
ncbi:MAG: hypothetical protein JXB26_15945 [Candidatus Aminicenantes bacterium]|nr:hypothetical protein [Candidatus Aminicenantes bacterium]